MRSFLRDVAFPIDARDEASLGRYLEPELRHHHRATGDLSECRAASDTLPAVYRAVTSIEDATLHFVPPDLPDEDPRVQRLFDESARAHGLARDGPGTRPLHQRGPSASDATVGVVRTSGGGSVLNDAAASLTEDVLVFARSDVPVEGLWPELLEALARPRVGAVAAAVVPAGAVGPPGCALTFRDRSLALEVLPLRSARTQAVPLLPDGLIAVRRDVFQAVGGFDEGLLSGRLEVVELSFRLWRMGLRCLVVPSGAVVEAPLDLHPRMEPLFLHDLLRVGAVHLDVEDLGRQAADAANEPSFARAAALLATGDAGTRRWAHHNGSFRSARWLFERFGVPTAPRAECRGAA